MNTNVTMIPVAQLHPHPDNPRKDLGDITELTASIKANGVLQNLTVVPRANPDVNYEELCRQYYADPHGGKPNEAESVPQHGRLHRHHRPPPSGRCQCCRAYGAALHRG